MKTLMPILLISLALAAPAKAINFADLIDLEVAPGIDAHRCVIQVEHGQKSLTIKNLMAQPGSLKTLSNLRPQRTGDKITFEFPNQFTTTPGGVSQCLSLIAMAKNDFPFMSEKSADERMLKIANNRYLDVCWKHGTGIRDPRKEKSDGHIYIYLAERTLVDEGDGKRRLSLSLGDIRSNEAIFVSGANQTSQIVSELGEVKVSCDYHTLTDEERETLKRQMREQLDGILGFERSPSSRSESVQTENRSVKVKSGNASEADINGGADLAE